MAVVVLIKRESDVAVSVNVGALVVAIYYGENQYQIIHIL